MISISDFVEYIGEEPLPPSTHGDVLRTERKVIKPPQAHPLLKQILEAESVNNADVKHSDYVTHLIIQRQASQYISAVDDVLRVLRDSTNTFSKCRTIWKGPHELNLTPPVEIFSHISDKDNSLNLTQIARAILMVSAAMKRLQESDALRFWTGQHRCFLHQHLILLAKDGVKLRRKLERIKHGLEDKLKSVTRIASKCKSDVASNLSSSGPDDDWEREPEESKFNLKQKFSKLKASAMNFVSFGKAHKSGSVTSCASDKEIPNIYVEVNPEPQQENAHETEVDVAVLHAKSNTASEDESICDDGFENGSSGLKQIVPDKAEHEPETELSKWCLEAIASNIAPPLKFKYSNFIYDEREIKPVMQDPDLEAVIEAGQLEQKDSMESTSSSGNGSSPEIKMQLPEYTSRRKESNTGKPTETTEPEVALMLNLKTAMKNVISEITYIIRDTERNWLSPELMVKSKSLGKELFHLIDFIVETAKLTGDSEFSSRLYPEDIDEIISVLDPLIKELSRCVSTVQNLYNMIHVDLQYLKELVTGLPTSGSLIIKDYLSDMSIDIDAAEAELPQSAAEFDVDIEELFG